MTDAAKLAGSLTAPQLILLRQHGEGYCSSLAVDLNCPSTPFWSNAVNPHPQPRYMVREALIRKGLIHHYNDAAGITQLGRDVLAICNRTANAPQPEGENRC